MILEIIEGFIYEYKLPWLILAVLIWFVIIFTCSFRQFLYALPIGIWTMIVGTILENFFIHHKFWQERYVLVPIGELDLFVIIGPFFAIGIFLIRFLPGTTWGKYAIVLILSILSTSIELLFIQFGFLKYDKTQWNAFYSIVAYTLGLMSALGFYYIYYHLPRKRIL